MGIGIIEIRKDSAKIANKEDIQTESKCAKFIKTSKN
jgi:hypothetical protein